MSVLVAGSTALDSIKTPYREKPRLLGVQPATPPWRPACLPRSGSWGSWATTFRAVNSPLNRRHGIDLAGLQRALRPDVPLVWRVRTENEQPPNAEDELGVLAGFNPPPARRLSPDPIRPLLANNAPLFSSQCSIKCRRPRFVVADTMDLWLNTAGRSCLSSFAASIAWC